MRAGECTQAHGKKFTAQIQTSGEYICKGHWKKNNSASFTSQIMIIKGIISIIVLLNQIQNMCGEMAVYASGLNEEREVKLSALSMPVL